MTYRTYLQGAYKMLPCRYYRTSTLSVQFVSERFAILQKSKAEQRAAPSGQNRDNTKTGNKCNFGVVFQQTMGSCQRQEDKKTGKIPVEFAAALIAPPGGTARQETTAVGC